MLKNFYSLRSLRRLFKLLVITVLTVGLMIGTDAYFFPVNAARSNNYCRFEESAIAQKEQLREQVFNGNNQAQGPYQEIVQQHAEQLTRCREKTWPQKQAIWLRVYPCDSRPGRLEQVLDQIVNSGYNQVYVEAFANSQVLLPTSSNNTAWKSRLRSPSLEKTDLLAEVIKKGHERNLKVYAWLFSMNFGYAYAQSQNQTDILVHNGFGENSLSESGEESQAFIDPYNQQARRQYAQMLSEILKREPDGVLFDYIRYPRSTGVDSVVSGVKNLWIYGNASFNTLLDRAFNEKGRFLIQRYLGNGYITRNDVAKVDAMEPEEVPPLWQGRNVDEEAEAEMSLEERKKLWQQQLWYLSVAHAAQGVIDFLSEAVEQVEAKGIPTGAVFFADANQVVGEQGFDSRLQPWTRFTDVTEWHPMAYATCNQASCIVDLVKKTRSSLPNNMELIPALAGDWGSTMRDRPPLESQMEVIRRQVPQVTAISHFAYSWQFPEVERERKFCSLP
ncbi:MAG: family 10 glycosylhydrolase [Halothece sp.]